MPSVTLTTEQVVDLVKQLPPHQRREVLLVLASDAIQQRDGRMSFAEDQLHLRAAERGLHWDDLGDDEREIFVDDLLHEKS